MSFICNLLKFPEIEKEQKEKDNIVCCQILRFFTTYFSTG